MCKSKSKPSLHNEGFGVFKPTPLNNSFISGFSYLSGENVRDPIAMKQKGRQFKNMTDFDNEGIKPVMFN